MSLPLYILSGGQSRRFGSDKARAVLHGVPLICRVAEGLESVAISTAAVAAQTGAYEDLGLRTIADRVAGRGPVGGLDAALRDAIARDEGPWVCLAACDLARAEPAWVQTLMAARHVGAMAVAFQNDRWQSMLGLYHTGLIPLIDEHLAENKWAMWQLLDRAEAVALAMPDDWPEPFQINTPEDFQSVDSKV